MQTTHRRVAGPSPNIPDILIPVPEVLDLEKRSNRNKAVCALANKMARLCYATLRDREPYAAAKLTRELPRKLAQASFSCA